MGSKIFKFLLLILFLLLIVSIGSFFVDSRNSFSDKGVKIEIEGPDEASVGDEVIYKVKYENNTKVALHDLNFLFFYPDESVIVKDNEISKDLTERFSVDRLSPGESDETDFKAFLIGDRGDMRTAKVSLSFRAGTIKSSFEKSAELTTSIIDVPLVLTLVAPPNIVSGQSLTYILDYRNESGNDVSDLRFEFTYPEGFTPQSFSPQPIRKSDNMWEVSFLKDGGGSRISITGVLNGNEGDSKTVSVRLKRKIEGEYLDYERASSTTTISNPLLGTDILVNNAADFPAYLGNTLNYVIKYNNHSDFKLNGLNLTAKLEGDMFDLSSLNTKGGFFDSSTKTILWNSGTVSNFANLKSGQRGQVEFTINLKDQFPSGLPGSSRDRLVKVSTKLSTPNVPSELSVSEIAVSDSNVTKISSKPVFGQIVYFNDPILGQSGFLPPKAGEETTFTVHWQVINPGDDISNAKITATFPSNVTWAGNITVDAGKEAPSYDQSASEVTWDIGGLPYGIGILAPKYEASFQIKVRPNDSDIGKIIKLLQNIKFQGTDNFTKQSIMVSGDDIDTNSLFDRPNQGIVVE
jgi:hypothetical protein